MDEMMKAYKEIIEKNCEDFLRQIHTTTHVSQYKARFKDTPGFPIFEPANDEYYEYSHFERYLEWRIREMLVNPTLGAFFEYLESNANSRIRARFPNDNTIRVGSRNENYENIVPFEFIVSSDIESIGYRYTPWYEMEGENYIDDNINHYGLDHVEIIHWEKNYKQKPGRRQDDRLIDIEARDFFNKYFNDDVYVLFLDSIKEAIKKANEIIGFKTIPSLSLRYLSDFKEVLRNDWSTICFNDLEFRVINKKRKKSKKYIYLEKHSFKPEDIECMDDAFKEGKMYNILLGNSDFAKCYITSEYLYKVFSGNEAFDYTAVICGYLKSVELLLEKIVKIDLKYADPYEKNYIGKKYTKDTKNSRNTYPDKKQFERKKRDGTKFYVDLIPFNKYYSDHDLVDLTIGALCYYLCDNNKWRISGTEYACLRDYILCYADECRNEYVHKGVLDDYKKVERIRDNTHYILYLLLSGCNSIERVPAGDDYFGCDEKELEFSRLYRAMAKLPISSVYYIVEDSLGKKHKLIKQFYQDLPEYDDYGNIGDSRILFVEVDSFDVDYVDVVENVDEERVYVIDKEHIPKSIIEVIRRTKKERPIVW